MVKKLGIILLKSSICLLLTIGLKENGQRDNDNNEDVTTVVKTINAKEYRLIRQDND